MICCLQVSIRYSLSVYRAPYLSHCVFALAQSPKGGCLLGTYRKCHTCSGKETCSTWFLAISILLSLFFLQSIGSHICYFVHITSVSIRCPPSYNPDLLILSTKTLWLCDLTKLLSVSGTPACRPFVSPDKIAFERRMGSWAPTVASDKRIQTTTTTTYRTTSLRFLLPFLASTFTASKIPSLFFWCKQTEKFGRVTKIRLRRCVTPSSAFG